MEFVTRINLKPNCKDRTELIKFCLKNEKQHVAIGWSYVYKEEDNITSFDEYYFAVRNRVKRINSALNVFKHTKENDLFWTKDLEGSYWICRATGFAEQYFDEKMDVGAVVPVKAYEVGIDIPGQIKASFNRPRGGTVEKISDENIIEYSKYIYNLKSGTDIYSYKKNSGDLLNNLPAFELEELVISYLQIKEDYYVLSNSIANKSTTVKIECELISRDKSKPRKAVVQVKGGHSTELDALEYEGYTEAGYNVYLYAPKIFNKTEKTIEITRKELKDFYNEYKAILPESITRWENLFSDSEKS